MHAISFRVLPEIPYGRPVNPYCAVGLEGEKEEEDAESLEASEGEDAYGIVFFISLIQSFLYGSPGTRSCLAGRPALLLFTAPPPTDLRPSVLRTYAASYDAPV